MQTFQHLSVLAEKAALSNQSEQALELVKIGLERCITEILVENMQLLKKPEPVVLRLMKDKIGFILLTSTLPEP